MNAKSLNFDCSSHINWKIYKVAGYGGTVHEVAGDINTLKLESKHINKQIGR